MRSSRRPVRHSLTYRAAVFALLSIPVPAIPLYRWFFNDAGLAARLARGLDLLETGVLFLALERGTGFRPCGFGLGVALLLAKYLV
jgi:hypothetical protein